MTWIEPISTTVTAVSLAERMLQSSSLIRKYADRLHYWLRNGSAVIPIFGAGGTGKTTAGRVLSGVDPLDLATPYDPSIFIDPVPLAGSVPGKLLVAPGQKASAERHWPTLFREVVRGRSIGFINVVAYGYHSFDQQSFADHDLYEEGMDAAAFMGKFLDAKRRDEIELLQRVLDGLAGVEGPLWMVTVVNKQDLWQADYQSVREHYQQGSYANVVDRFMGTLGVQRFQHVCVPVSLIPLNFKTKNGETLASTTCGYDQPMRMDSLQNMFKKVHEMIARGAQDHDG